MTTPSPTPSEDNRKNTGEIAMLNALDKVMTNPVQSYDEFLNGFTYLKQGMQEKQTTKKVPKQSVVSAARTKTMSELPKSNTDSTDSRKESSNIQPDSDDVEEELLCDGDITSRISQTKVIKTGSIVKFDNYVEEADDIDDVAGDGYMASFSADKSASNEVRREKMAVCAPLDQQNSDTDPLSDLCQSLSLDENSTDKLLMNFLADLQNEMNDTTVPNTRNILPDGPIESNSGMDIQDFLSRNKKPKRVTDDVNINDSDDDEEDDNALDLLFDDSENNDVKVTINKQELSDELKKTVEVDKKTKLQEIYRNALMDSEGVMRAHSDLINEDKAHTVEERKDIVFPGQIEEMDDDPVYENETLLDFKATYRTEEQCSEISRKDVCTDTIQPFQLDEDFDYDNVVLTPKFSIGDMNTMNTSLTPQTSVS